MTPKPRRLEKARNIALSLLGAIGIVLAAAPSKVEASSNPPFYKWPGNVTSCGSCQNWTADGGWTCPACSWNCNCEIVPSYIAPDGSGPYRGIWYPGVQ